MKSLVNLSIKFDVFFKKLLEEKKGNYRLIIVKKRLIISNKEIFLDFIREK